MKWLAETKRKPLQRVHMDPYGESRPSIHWVILAAIRELLLLRSTNRFPLRGKAAARAQRSRRFWTLFSRNCTLIFARVSRNGTLGLFLHSIAYVRYIRRDVMSEKQEAGNSRSWLQFKARRAGESAGCSWQLAKKALFNASWRSDTRGIFVKACKASVEVLGGTPTIVRSASFWEVCKRLIIRERRGSIAKPYSLIGRRNSLKTNSLVLGRKPCWWKPSRRKCHSARRCFSTPLLKCTSQSIPDGVKHTPRYLNSCTSGNCTRCMVLN